MDTVTDDTVVLKLRELLQTADMETTTGMQVTLHIARGARHPRYSATVFCCTVERQLRKSLEQQLGIDLSGHKALIRAEVRHAVLQQPPMLFLSTFWLTHYVADTG